MGLFDELNTPTWPLAEVLAWRRRIVPIPMQDAFEELREICLSKRATAWGLRCFLSLEQLQGRQPLAWEPFVGLPCDEIIPADDWQSFHLAVDDAGRPTGGLEGGIRLLEWSGV